MITYSKETMDSLACVSLARDVVDAKRLHDLEEKLEELMKKKSTESQ